VAGPEKRAQQNGQTIVWVDESGFYLLPGRVRTFANLATFRRQCNDQ
jgi:hypothetical protein